MFLQDCYYGIRALGKRPAYAAVTIAVLALAIGANTTVFSVLNGFFLRPLPYADDDRIAMIYNTYPRMGLEMAGTSIPDYFDRREQANLLEELAIYTGGSRTLGGDGSPEQLLVLSASPSLFDVLGVAPRLVTAGVAVLAAIGSALLPLASLFREDLARAVQEAGRLGSGGRRAHGFRSALVVVQIAASVALLVGAGLLTKSFYRLQSEQTGFDSANVWTARIAVPATRYPDGASIAQFYEHALEELAALPGVTEAGYTSILPFAGMNSQGSYTIDGYTPPDGASPPHGQQRVVSEGYLPSLGIPVVKGRNFERNESEPVVLVDEVFVDQFFPDDNVLGQRLRMEFPGEWYTIAGVVPTVKHSGLDEDPSKETIYWHYKQDPVRSGVITLRTALPPDQVTGAATAAILRVDPDVPVSNVMSMEARVVDSLGPQRAPMALMLVFAGVAFTLAVIGIYGVLTWAVTQRHGEIGVRMALGAKAADIVRMVLTQGTRLIVIGLAFGVAGAFALGRLMSSQIYDVSAADPTVFAVAVIGLTTAALLASWLPARRASRIDPMLALREE
jgi:predicted permease